MKLNVKRFCELLAEAPEEAAVPTDGCNEYLLEQVLRPSLRDNAPRLKDIDYDKFEEEDIRELADYYEQLWRMGEKLAQLSSAIGSIEPVPCRARQFC